MTDIYDIEIQKQDGSPQKMSDYKGKILLIVNTATGCGFTPQYQELQELYERYQKGGFESWISPAISLASRLPETLQKSTAFAALTTERPFPDLPRLMSMVLIPLHSLTGSKKKRAVFWAKT